ncbi:MFS transporter [Candidatus Woesearchaeota archaeon]|nr:MFS transporter [Candidatus Woesearchaeota archaeon]
MFKKDELKLLWPFYLHILLVHIFGIGAMIWTVYFANKGFSFSQVGVAMAIMAIGSIAFEVPTGAIADIFGRKTSVVLAYFLYAIVALWAPFVKSYYALISLFILWSVAICLQSGADEAWVIDFLKKEKKQALIQTYYTKWISIGQIGILIGGLLLTSILILYRAEEKYVFFGRNFIGSDAVWFIQAIGMFIATLILIFFAKEYFDKKKIRLHQGLWQTFVYSKKAMQYAWHHHLLFWIFLTIFIFGIFQGMFGFIYQPLLIDFGFGLADFGWLRSAAGIVGIFIPFLSMFFVKKIKSTRNLLAFTFLIDFVIVACATLFFGRLLGFVYYLIVMNAGLFLFPIWGPFVQRYTPSKIRATLGSVRGMLSSLGTALGLFAVGPLVDHFGAKLSLSMAAVLIIPIFIIYFFIRKR